MYAVVLRNGQTPALELAVLGHSYARHLRERDLPRFVLLALAKQTKFLGITTLYRDAIFAHRHAIDERLHAAIEQVLVAAREAVEAEFLEAVEAEFLDRSFPLGFSNLMDSSSGGSRCCLACRR